MRQRQAKSWTGIRQFCLCAELDSVPFRTVYASTQSLKRLDFLPNSGAPRLSFLELQRGTVFPNGMSLKASFLPGLRILVTTGIQDLK